MSKCKHPLEFVTKELTGKHCHKCDADLPDKQPELEELFEALEKARLGITDKTPDTPVSFAGWDVWENLHTVALVQALLKWRTDSTLLNKREHEANCEADDRHCTCGAKYYNQAISEMERKLK